MRMQQWRVREYMSEADTDGSEVVITDSAGTVQEIKDLFTTKMDSPSSDTVLNSAHGDSFRHGQKPAIHDPASATKQIGSNHAKRVALNCEHDDQVNYGRSSATRDLSKQTSDDCDRAIEHVDNANYICMKTATAINCDEAGDVIGDNCDKKSQHQGQGEGEKKTPK